MPDILKTFSIEKSELLFMFPQSKKKQKPAALMLGLFVLHSPGVS